VTTDMRIDQELQPLSVAKILAKIVEEEDPSLVLLGKQSIDGDCAQTGELFGRDDRRLDGSSCCVVADATKERV